MSHLAGPCFGLYFETGSYTIAQASLNSYVAQLPTYSDLPAWVLGLEV